MYGRGRQLLGEARDQGAARDGMWMGYTRSHCTIRLG